MIIAICLLRAFENGDVFILSFLLHLLAGIFLPKKVLWSTSWSDPSPEDFPTSLNILKSIFLSFYLLIYLTVPDLNCSTWGGTCSPALGEWGFSHWNTWEVPEILQRKASVYSFLRIYHTLYDHSLTAAH